MYWTFIVRDIHVVWSKLLAKNSCNTSKITTDTKEVYGQKVRY